MDKTQFSLFFEENLNKIYRFIFLKVGARAVAEDLTSETFKRLWDHVRDNDNISDFRALAYEVARNLVIDHYRDRDKDTMSLDDAFVTLASDKSREASEIEASIALNSDIEQVRQALEGVRPEHAEALILHYLNDLSIKEVARALNQEEGTVRVWIHRGLVELREKLT